MTAMLLADGEALPLRRIALAGTPGFDEAWLQALLFAHPDLIPLERMQPGAGGVLPLAREFAIPRPGGPVFLDLIGLARTGRLVLVECKLWRNPQSRREVVAQILEYAALLRGWSYADLSARLIASQGWQGPNPLYARALRRWPDLDEAAFVDGLAASLAAGDFHLIVAGDGIRSDVQALAAHLNAGIAGPARLSLLEMRLWTDGGGRTVVTADVPLRTEVIEQRVIAGADGVPLRLTSRSDAPDGAQGVEAAIDPARAQARAVHRAFWQAFIDEARFDHPDQPPPRHGGTNWVRLDLPRPPGSLTAYRTEREIGLFVILSGEDGAALFEALAGEAGTLASESGLDLSFTVESRSPFKGRIGVRHPLAPDLDEAGQRRWAVAAANRLVTVLRPRLTQWQRAGSAAATA